MFRGGQKPQPGLYARNVRDSHQSRRQRQIELLRQGFPRAQCISPDQSVWDVPLELSPGRDLKFPEAAPDVRVVGDYAHALIDDRGAVVGNKKLSSWNSKVDLSRVLQEIFAEFKRNPPRPHAPRGPPMTAAPPQWATATTNAHAPQQQQQQQQRMSQFSVPQPQPQPPPRPTPQYFPELDSMSRERLEELLSDAQLYMTFLDSLPAVVNPRKVRDDTSADNLAKAHANLSNKPVIEQLQADIGALRAANEQLRAEFDALAQRQQAALRRFEPRALAAALGQFALAAEDSTDQLGRALEIGDADVKEMPKYVAARANMHRLRSKQDRLASLTPHLMR